MKSLLHMATVYDQSTDTFEIVEQIVQDDGTTIMGIHFVPNSALEWTAAIYGTNDIETVLNIIMYQPYAPSYNAFEAPADEALLRHTEIIDAAKAELVPAARGFKPKLTGVAQKYIDASVADPIQVIKDNARFDPEVIAEKQKQVEYTRQAIVLQAQDRRRQEEVRMAMSSTARAEAARKQLFRQNNMRREVTPE